MNARVDLATDDYEAIGDILNTLSAPGWTLEKLSVDYHTHTATIAASHAMRGKDEVNDKERQRQAEKLARWIIRNIEIPHSWIGSVTVRYSTRRSPFSQEVIVTDIANKSGGG
jgi:hypothetical protein